MNHRTELEIKKPQDMAVVAGILVDNGYRVWPEKVKKGTRSTQTTILCADKPDGKAVQAE